jgi:serine phosphatase RsbU (regulator of sigma subunit)
MVKKVVQPDFPGQIAGPLLLLPVLLSAWYGGLGPGLFTAVLSYMTLNYFFLPTIYSLDPGWVDIPIGGIYLLVALVVSTLHERGRRAEETAGRLKERMLLARSIQLRLLPQAPPNIPGFDIAGACCPAEETGGDFFDFLPMRDGRIGVIVGDVSGHGFPSALLMAEIRAYLRALALAHDDVGQILTLTNSMLAADTDDDLFATLFMACIHPTDRSLVYAGAGHEAYLLHAAGRRTRLRSTGLPLGVAMEAVVSQAEIALGDGDFLILFTDGNLEAHSQQGEQFGIDRMIEAVHANRAKSAREIVDRLVERVRVFSRHMPQEDDMTTVLVKVNSQG